MVDLLITIAVVLLACSNIMTTLKLSKLEEKLSILFKALEKAAENEGGGDDGKQE